MQKGGIKIIAHRNNFCIRLAQVSKGAGVQIPSARLGPQDTNGNATGGEFRWIYNAELSLKPTKNWRLVGFFDIGALVNAFDQMVWDQVRYSAGPGLRYITPVGPVRLDYGIKLDRRTGEDFGRLHFTFGYVF
jgi:outer membrane protein insertion porin family